MANLITFLADAGDEIDVELLGGDRRHWQTNMFAPNPADKAPLWGVFSSMEDVPRDGSVTDFHSYSIDWSPDRIIWSVDGETTRTLTREDSNVHGQLHYPSHPLRLSMGIWDASTPVGTAAWGKGPIDWESAPKQMSAVCLHSYHDRRSLKYSRAMISLSERFELSSPASSPPFGPDDSDSSPPGSPSSFPSISLDSPPGPSHPFAASSSANRRPPLYEKKNLPSSSVSSSNYHLKAPRACSEAYRKSHEDDYLKDPHDTRERVTSPTHQDREAQLWDKAITDAIDNGNGTINLGSSLDLSYIPPSIGDLCNFYVTPATAAERNVAGNRFFERNLTPTGSLGSRTFERTASVKERSAGLSREDIHLYLYQNKISLFRNMTELHVPNNLLTYLPAEMLHMKLFTLTVHGNQFLHKPSLQPGKSIHITPTTYAKHSASPHMPSLLELCYRVLLSPSPLEFGGNVTTLAGYYTLPIPGAWGDKPLPPSVRDVLNACIPESVSAPKTMSPNSTPRACLRTRIQSVLSAEVEDEILGAGVCPNPAHSRKSAYVRHVEERFTWVDVIAGVSVGQDVPIKWRGCSKGCLSFLDGDEIVNSDAAMAIDLDSEMEMDEDEDVIQPIIFSPSAFGAEDFEDDA
ncbi:hypothetical protein HWV62_27646 [Athelia sp. TMB]|nr:hypothetical protein HWV62_27646 [Athelia sp. TMB]